MDALFFKPIIDGTLNTLKVQCSVQGRPAQPFIKSGKPKFNCEIAAIVGLTSSKLSGSMALCFAKPTFLSLMSKMLGESFTEITNEVEDGASELLNMIFGHAKRILNDSGHDIQKAIPSIIRGQNLEARHLTTRPIIVLPFLTEFGEFHIEIGVEEK